ncbi:helix-turn-helix domain-containing protein, partial [uncultured Duncaniella sp.]|uniref:AlbA family DNA-binding domain-containing protein n=1 Tax=uncultured Duncaniella sp. TaxID=2768039 RepID=UPI0026F06B79
MTIEDIRALVAADESRTLELKKSTGELKDGMHSACAFLNTEGGWLVFGVAPKSLKIVGQEVTDKTQQEIAQALAGLEPAVDVNVEYVDVPEYPGHKVIAMHFDGWV